MPMVNRLNVEDLNFVEEFKYIIVLCNAEIQAVETPNEKLKSKTKKKKPLTLMKNHLNSSLKIQIH